MDDIIKQIAEAIDDDPLDVVQKRVADAKQREKIANKKRAFTIPKGFKPSQADPITGAVQIQAQGEHRSQRPDKKQWLKEKLVEFNQIDNLSDLSEFIQSLDLKAQINFNDYDRLVKQRKTLEQTYQTAQHNYRSMLKPEDVGLGREPSRHDVAKIKNSPELMQAWKAMDVAQEALQNQAETETKIVDQIKHYLTAGENDLAMALERQFDTLDQPEIEDDNLENTDWDKSRKVAAGFENHSGGKLAAYSQTKSKFPVVKYWKDYFSHNPNEYVFIAYSGLGGQRTVRQIKLREIHERMLDRRLPNLEILDQLDDQDQELIGNSATQQFRTPDHLLGWLESSQVTFSNLVDDAKDAQMLEAAIDRWPDLWIQLEQYDETNPDHLADMKATVKDLFNQYIQKYTIFTNNLKKHLEGEAPSDAGVILKLAQKPVLEATVIPGAPARAKMSLAEEDKYSTSTLTFYTQKNTAEKPYTVLDPWPIGWQTPGQPLKCTFNNEGRTVEEEFTPEEIYTMDLVNILPNFRIANLKVQKAGEEGDADFQSSIQLYSNDPGYKPGRELNVGNPVIKPWSSYNQLDPYEKVDFQYEDPITFDIQVARGVTRKEIWESDLMQLSGATILGKTEQPDAIAVLNKETMGVKYLAPEALEKVKNSPRLSKSIIFPNEGQFLDDNGQAQTNLIQTEMQGLSETGALQYSNLIPPGEAFSDSEKVKKSLKWANTRVSSENKRKYSQTDRDYSRLYASALELDQNGETLPDTLADVRDKETGKLKPWLKNGYLETPYGDRLKIKAYGVYHVVDFPVRKHGTEERDFYQNMPLRRAVELVERLWFDSNYKATSLAVPQADGTILIPIITDANGFKSVNYPSASGAGRIILSLKEALAKKESDLKNFKERGKSKAQRGFCFARLDPEKRSPKRISRNKKLGLPSHVCGDLAPHMNYPPTLKGTPGNWELEPGDPVDPASDGTYQSYQGLCDRHYAAALEIMPRTVLDQMTAWLQDIQNGPVIGGSQMKSMTTDPPREGGTLRLGDPDYDQDEVIAEIREWTIAFLQAWFGDDSWLNVLGEFVAQSDLSAGQNDKSRGVKIRLLESMRKLYQDLFSMVSSTIAIDSSFADEGVTYQPIDPGNEQNLLTAGRWTEEDYPEDQGVADGKPFLWHAYKGIYAKIYNYYLAQWRRADHHGDDYTTLPFAQMVAGDIRRKNQLRAALRDQRFPSTGGTPRIRKGNIVLRRPKGEGRMESLELDYADVISEAKEIDDIIRKIGRTML